MMHRSYPRNASPLYRRSNGGCERRDRAQPPAMAGILISTGTPGSEGSLGGLIEQGRELGRHLEHALALGRLCSNDPVCASHDPEHDLAERHRAGAACPRLPLHLGAVLRAVQPVPRPRARGPGDRPGGAGILRGRGVSLAAVGRAELEALARRIERGELACPLRSDRPSHAGLAARAPSLFGHDRDATLAIIGAALAERDVPRPAVELVWTGPDVSTTSARDTAVVVRELFARATRSVLVAGYAFDHGEEILRPLHAVMRDRGVEAELFLDVPRAASAAVVAEHLMRFLDAFRRRNWPSGRPSRASFTTRAPSGATRTPASTPSAWSWTSAGRWSARPTSPTEGTRATSRSARSWTTRRSPGGSSTAGDSSSGMAASSAAAEERPGRRRARQESSRRDHVERSID
jgi:hypothetical protein